MSAKKNTAAAIYDSRQIVEKVYFY